MTQVRIEADDIVFAHGDFPVLRKISLSIEAGELFAIVGPSGAGKTTLLRVIAGLAQPSAGSIRINGRPIDDIPLPQRNIGMVFQNLSLWPHMTVFENAAFGLPRPGIGAETVKARVERMLDLLDIGETRDVRPDCLSAGQQQRVALARALVSEPRLLLLDDPFSKLEPELRLQMRRDLHALQRRLGITTILVTHDLEDALGVSDRLAVIVHGRIRQIGTPAALYDFPNAIDVARFFGAENFLPGTLRHVDSQQIEFSSPDLGTLRWPLRERPPEGASLLSIRPHALHIGPLDSFRDGRYAWLEGRIVSSEFLGESVRYRVAVGDLSLSVKQPHFLGAPPTPSGTPVLVAFDPSRARLFAAPDASDPAGSLA